jgi:hypothetical protein
MTVITMYIYIYIYIYIEMCVESTRDRYLHIDRCIYIYTDDMVEYDDTLAVGSEWSCLVRSV